jgi:polyferredoxin
MWYFSPYLIVAGAFEGLISGSFIMFIVLFAVSLFFGRGFCGYICAAGGVQECFAHATGKEPKGGWRNYIKYVIWVLWLASIVILFLRAGGVKAVDIFFHTSNGFSLYPSTYIIYYGVMLIFVLMSLLGGKRAMCHYLCWMAPFMVIGTKLSNLLHLPRLRLRAEKENCIGCKRCTKACPMSLSVQEMAQKGDMKNSECILCGECVDTCPKKVIHYALTDKKRQKED